MPHCSLLATPLYTKRLCNVPLAEALLKPGKLQTPQVVTSVGTAALHEGEPLSWAVGCLQGVLQCTDFICYL